MSQKLRRWVVLLLLLVHIATNAAWAQDAALRSGRIPAATQNSALEAYHIGPEDVLQIVVWHDSNLSRTVPVRPDGMISLPLLNDVQAAGLTATELRAVLMKKLAEYMPAPEVSVIVSEVRSFKVSVIGEVNHPTRYELKRWTTVLDALALAGGFTQYASRSKVVILRPYGKTVKRIPFNYSKVISGDEEDLYLQPDDIVLVP